MDRMINSFRPEKLSARRATFLSLTGEVESQLQSAYDERNRNHGVTQSSMAKVLGINRSAINHRLRGLTNMTLMTLADMVWALGYAIKVIIYDPAKTLEHNSFIDIGIPAAPEPRLMKASFSSSATEASFGKVSILWPQAV